jgi:hypothetical protein
LGRELLEVVEVDLRGAEAFAPGFETVASGNGKVDKPRDDQSISDGTRINR